MDFFLPSPPSAAIFDCDSGAEPSSPSPSLSYPTFRGLRFTPKVGVMVEKKWWGGSKFAFFFLWCFNAIINGQRSWRTDQAKLGFCAEGESAVGRCLKMYVGRHPVDNFLCPGRVFNLPSRAPNTENSKPQAVTKSSIFDNVAWIASCKCTMHIRESMH